jgi:hypothetical protein
MKTPSRGWWRPIRYLLLLASAGVVIAADNSWMTKLRFDFADATNWLTNFYSPAAPSVEVPAVVAQTALTTADTTLSLNSPLNSYLFSKPSAGWQLAAAKFNRTSILAAQQASGPIVQVNGATLPAAAFSSGYTAYSSTDFGPLPPTLSAPTASGIWTSNATGTWGSATNWQGGVIADGAGSTAHFDALNITTPVTVLLDTSRTIGELYVGDTDGTDRYTISPTSSTLTFDNVSNTAILQQSSTSAGDTINVSILLNGDLDVKNLSASNPFTISGNIAPASAGFHFLTFAGTINVSGNISGTSLSVGINSGVTTFTGTNTYKGTTSVDGTLLVNGNNSGATGTTFVSGTGSVLGGTGTIGSNNVQTFNGTITGATTTTVGTLTFLGNVDLSTHEGTGTYLANLIGNMSDLLAITGTLSLGEGSILDIDGVGDGITTYTLATFASRDDVFGSVLDIPSGYALVYHDMDIQLVPIPEPATWIGGALALGAFALAQRRRLRSYWLSVIG